MLIPINQSKHWYLVLLTPTRITVMESIKRTPEEYAKNQIFVNLHRLARRLYGAEAMLEVK